MIGGDGNDIYMVDNPGDTIVENANEGQDNVYSSASLVLPANVENLFLQGSAGLQAYGNELSNTIYGNSGSNLIDGRGGADAMVGGAGDDLYYVDDPGDTIYENPNEGQDNVYSSASLVLGPNIENLFLQGTADLQAYGNELSNTIYGNSGSNLIDGRGGADAMVGGDGNDLYYVDDPGDTIYENPNGGEDNVQSSASLVLGPNIENLFLTGSADLQGYGNALSNTIYGNSGNNIIDGGAGADAMVGGAGNDFYYVDDPGDSIYENPNEGTDIVYSTASLVIGPNIENLVLQGSANLQGYGNSQANAIFGNSGNNLIDGRGGADVLTGGAGNDTFFFKAGEANGDTVVDFAGNGAAAGDSLQFSGYGAGATFTNIDATHWQVNYNGGASHDVITFSNGASVDPSDFTFI
jgi:Ca2+-binding RTX toxin-like protein